MSCRHSAILLVTELCRFRWVFCQLETLRRSSPPAIRRVLDELPKSLDETYEKTLLGIEEEQRDYAHRLFQCLTVAVRPLCVEELAEILAIRFGPGQLPEYHVDWRSEDPQEDILHACSTLITVVDVKGSQIVQFSHFSVKEFLTSDRLAIAAENLSRYYILRKSAHTILAQASLSVLLHLDDQVDKITMKNFPLAVYAAQQWVDHAHFEDVSSLIEDQMECLFDANKSHFAAWVWIYDIDHPFREPMFSVHPTPPEAVPLYYATLFGLGNLVEHLAITHPGHVNMRGGFYATPLHAAVAKGYSKIVLLLLEQGADTNILDNQRFSPLHRASRAGRCDIVEILLEHHADVDIGTTNDVTPLHLASIEGELKVACVLLQHGSAVDSRDDRDWTPLMSASRYGHLDIVQELLGHGADANAQEKNLSTALHLASEAGNLEIARLLLLHNAAVNVRDRDGATPLHLASGLETARLLIEHGADVNSRDDNSWTPCHTASWNGHLDIVRLLLEHVDAQTAVLSSLLAMASWNGMLEVSRFLIDRGADVNSRNDTGWTSLHLASLYGHLDAARLLLDHGADVNAQKADLWTPLHLASYNGHLSVADLLIQRGADTDRRSEDQETPLDGASRNGKLETARLLVKCGSNANLQDSNGWAPLHRAAQNGHLDLVGLLLEFGADYNIRSSDGKTALDLACDNGKARVARFLADRMGRQLDAISENSHPDPVQSSLGRVGDTTISDSGERTSLHDASRDGNLDVVQSLLNGGADVNEPSGPNLTPLHVVSQRGGRVEVAMLLIEYGANVHSRSRAGWTPLHFASRYENMDVMRLLLDHGADVNTKKQDLWTPLHFASYNGDLEMVKLLLERGASVHVWNDEGRTPFQIASRRGEREIAQLLSG